MTELELFDRLNPRRDLPQATCDVISQVYKVMESGLIEKENQIKELQKENARLKKESEENQDLATVAYMQGASKNKAKLDEAKTIIQDLLSNSDEYARQRVMDWLKEE